MNSVCIYAYFIKGRVLLMCFGVCGLRFSKQLDENHSSLRDLLMLNLFSDETTALALNFKFVFVVRTVLAHSLLQKYRSALSKKRVL